MIELNLLPDVKKEFIRAQRTRNMVISGAIFVCIIAVGAIALLATTVYGAQTVWIKNLNKEITANHQIVEDKQEINKYLAVQSQLQSLDQTAQQRSVYSRLFDFLPQLNPAPPFNVTIYDFVLAKDTTTITMAGAADSFEAVNNFKYTLEQAQMSYTLEDGTTAQAPLFASVISGAPSLSSSSAGKVQAIFDFTITFSSEAFDQSHKDIKISVPKLVTSDGDRNAPKELFGVDPQTVDGGQNGQ
jgi:Tfp pilus assembly protein PilN